MGESFFGSVFPATGLTVLLILYYQYQQFLLPGVSALSKVMMYDSLQTLFYRKY
jgi:hypothetical protein